MFGQVPTTNPYAQVFSPNLNYPNPQHFGGVGPISPLMPQQAGGQMHPFGGDPFGFGASQHNPMQSQSWLQRDPRAEILANTIANITATRDPRVDYLAQIVTHPVVASNPVLKDLVAKELLTAALEQVTLKAIRPETQNPLFAGGAQQIGFGQGYGQGYGQGIDPYTAAAIKSQVLAEIAKSQAAQLARGGLSQWGSQPFAGPFAG